MLDRLRSYLGGSEVTVIRECRECGTEVGADGRQCPRCDSSDVARYEIE